MIARKNWAWLAGCLLLAGCGGERDGNTAAAAGNEAAAAKAAQQDDRTIADALAGSVDHSSFVEALTSSGLIETFRGVGPYTVLAPTNAAFAAMPEDARRRLAAADQREQLIARLSYHIVPGTVTLQDLIRAVERGPGGRAELASVTGANLGVRREGEAIVIEDGSGGRARITAADQIQSNGVVHSIDTVLTPEG